MGKRYTVCTVQIRKIPVPERYLHVYWTGKPHYIASFMQLSKDDDVGKSLLEVRFFSAISACAKNAIVR